MLHDLNKVWLKKALIIFVITSRVSGFSKIAEEIGCPSIFIGGMHNE